LHERVRRGTVVSVKLGHAVKVAKEIASGEKLTPEQVIAVHVLAEFGDRVVKTRPSMRAVMRALDGEELNQEPLLPEQPELSLAQRAEMLRAAGDEAWDRGNKEIGAKYHDLARKLESAK